LLRGYWEVRIMPLSGKTRVDNLLKEMVVILTHHYTTNIHHLSKGMGGKWHRKQSGSGFHI
jgi:hypothetical protein